MSGQVDLLPVYHAQRVRNPSVIRISAFIRAAQSVTAAQPGCVYIMFTNPAEIKILPQDFSNTSHTQCWHCRTKKKNKASSPVPKLIAAHPNDTQGVENPIPRARVKDSKNSHSKNLQSAPRLTLE